MDHIDPRIAPLIDAYIDHTIDDAQFAALCDWLREDAANRTTFARKLALHSAIAEWCVERSGGMLADELQTAAGLDAAGQAAAAADEHTWIDELSGLDDPAGQSDRADAPLTPRELVGLTGYTLGLALTNKAAKRIYAYAGVAAAVLLAAVLFNPWGGDDTSTDAPLVDQQQDPQDQLQPGTTYVATLTAEHNAVWSEPSAEGALAPGSPLRAGQTLTLTAGFAEVTTHDGAVAILEAPATIQLINNNAIRLHTGKLVGICETESSKGFLVRTPHMDITDLGTRFGVDASAPDATELHVFDGEVQAIRTDGPLAGHPMLVVTGQSVSTASDDGSLAMANADGSRFDAIPPKVTRLPGTGVGIDHGKADPNWSVVAVQGKPLANPIELVQHGTSDGRRSTPDDPTAAQWLGLIDTRSIQADQDAVYTIRTTIELPRSIDLDTARLRLSLHVDNRLEQVVINGHSVAAVEQAPELSRQRDTFLLPNTRVGLRHGTNTVEFHVFNKALTPMHLHIAWQIEQPRTLDFSD